MRAACGEGLKGRDACVQYGALMFDGGDAKLEAGHCRPTVCDTRPVRGRVCHAPMESVQTPDPTLLPAPSPQSSAQSAESGEAVAEALLWQIL